MCTCALIIIFLCSKVLRSLIKREIFISWNSRELRRQQQQEKDSFSSKTPNWATTLTTTATTLTTFNFRPKRVCRWMISPLFFPYFPFFPTSWFNFLFFCSSAPFIFCRFKQNGGVVVVVVKMTQKIVKFQQIFLRLKLFLC